MKKSNKINDIKGVSQNSISDMEGDEPYDVFEDGVYHVHVPVSITNSEYDLNLSVEVCDSVITKIEHFKFEDASNKTINQLIESINDYINGMDYNGVNAIDLEHHQVLFPKAEQSPVSRCFGAIISTIKAFMLLNAVKYLNIIDNKVINVSTLLQKRVTKICMLPGLNPDASVLDVQQLIDINYFGYNNVIINEAKVSYLIIDGSWVIYQPNAESLGNSRWCEINGLRVTMARVRTAKSIVAVVDYLEFDSLMTPLL